MPMSEADAKIKRGEDVPWKRWQMTALDSRRRQDGRGGGSESGAEPASTKPGTAARAKDGGGKGSGQGQQVNASTAGKGPAGRPAPNPGPALAKGSGPAAAKAAGSAPAPDAAKRKAKGAAAGQTAAGAAGKAPGQRGGLGQKAGQRGRNGQSDAQSATASDAEGTALDAEHKRLHEAARKKGHAEGLKAGQAEGYAKGLEEGRKAAHEELQQQIEAALRPVQHLAVHFSDALALLNNDMAKDLVELALVTGRQLAGDALNANPGQVVDLVRALLHSEPAMHGKPRLWLHPQDHDLVDEYLGNELKAAGWALQPDDQVSRGGCRVTSATGELDATWESRWEAVRQQVRGRHSASEQASAAQALLDEAQAAVPQARTPEAPELESELESEPEPKLEPEAAGTQADQ